MDHFCFAPITIDYKKIIFLKFEIKILWALLDLNQRATRYEQAALPD